jgi:cysteine-S-conjugate beta-lyase
MTSSKASLTTQISHIARQSELTIRTVNLPVQRGSTVLFESLAQAFQAGDSVARSELNKPSYGTIGLTTSIALMEAVASIEGRGHATKAALMPSGLAAISVAMLAFVNAGDHILVTDSVYAPTRMFCDGFLAKMNIATTYFDPAIAPDDLATLIQANTKIIYFESPGSYTFEIQDIPAHCDSIKKVNTHRLANAQIISIVDNAWGSPMFSNAFDWGVDVSIVPLTKYWSGHSDVLMGTVVVREALWPALYAAQRQLGICVSSDDAYLVLRGLRTVAVRMQQQQQTALKVAQWLQSHPAVKSVLYPALPSHPNFSLWQRDFSGASGLFSFELDPAIFASLSPQEHWQKLGLLCDKREFFGIGYSWGGYESLIMPARIDSARTFKKWPGGPLIRLQIGLESASDLIGDLQDGLILLTS